MNIATAKPMMAAAKAAASKPSGLPLVRARRPSRRALRTMSQIQPKSPTRPTSRNVPSHWLSRIGAFRSGLSTHRSASCRGLARGSASHAFDEPRLEIGTPADESRISCKRALLGDQARPTLGKEQTLHRADGSRRDDLMTIAMGITRGTSGRMSRGRSHRSTTVAAAIAPGSASGTRSPGCP